MQYSVRSVVLNLRKPNFGGSASFSRVCFTSASKGKHASEETDNSYNVDEAITYVGDESSGLQRNIKDGDRMGGLQGNIKDGDRMGDQQVNEKQVDKRTNQDENMKEEKPHNWKQSTTGMAANKAGEGISEVADKVKSTTGKTVDAVNSVAEKAKETIKGAWEATKEAKQNISGTSSGTSSIDNVDDLWEDHTGKPKDHIGKPNPHVGKT